MHERMTAMSKGMPFDAIVASSLENVYYLSGTLILTQRLIPDRLALVLWPQTGDPTFVICTIEESLARAESWIKDIRAYVEFLESPIAVLADVIRGHGLAEARLGVEVRHLTAAFHEEMKRYLPRARFEPCEGFLAQVRMVKSPEEIRRLEDAATATDRAIWEVFSRTAPGMTELDVSSEMQRDLLRRGAETVAFCVLGAGERTMMAHPLPTPRVLVDGDLLRTDFGGSFRGYYSDLARTMVVGRASTHQRDIYDRLWSVHSEIIAQLRPGMLAAQVFDLCKTAFHRQKLTFNMPHVGHSLGIGLHEFPLLAPHVREPLAPGMVLAFEPMHFEPTGERYHVEDLIEITADGYRILSRTGEWDRLLETAIEGGSQR